MTGPFGRGKGRRRGRVAISRMPAPLSNSVCVLNKDSLRWCRRYNRPLYEVVEVATASLKGGARVLQQRDKSRDKGEVLPVARELKSLCDEHGALFIFNDDADLAVASGAHGLHLGQADLPIGEARRVLAPTQIVGKSNSGIEEAMSSQSDGADYLAVGAVFSTTTMGKSGRTAVGTEMISKVKEMAQQPVVAIGGINETNIVDVVRAGADCVCVVSAITYADDPEAATSRLAEAIQNA